MANVSYVEAIELLRYAGANKDITECASVCSFATNNMTKQLIVANFDAYLRYLFYHSSAEDAL